MTKMTRKRRLSPPRCRSVWPVLTPVGNMSQLCIEVPRQRSDLLALSLQVSESGSTQGTRQPPCVRSALQADDLLM